MINVWWVTRPKRKLDSVPEVLAAFAGISLEQVWNGQRTTQMSFEDALEQAGLKRVGERRDQSGSGGRTYAAWLKSLGLIFRQTSTGNIRLTLAGEAIMDGDSPVEVLKNQVLKYQFPSTFSISRGVNMSPRFHIHPFRFLLSLLMDDRIGYLTQEEIAKVVITEAETARDLDKIVNHVLDFRERGNAALDADFFEKYGPSRGTVNLDHPFSHLTDIANTLVNWMEYTQLARRDGDGCLRVLDEKREEVERILETKVSFIPHPEDEERFQRAYGLDPKHKKDLRNLNNTATVTPMVIARQKIKSSYIRFSMTHLVTGIEPILVKVIAGETGLEESLVEEELTKLYPHGSVDSFLNSYFNMAFQGTEEAVQFEKTTTLIFQNVFGYKSIHLGQTGSKSAPDILLVSDSVGYQAIIDNKAYSKYSITGDHHNRMVHNYIERLVSYSNYLLPIGFFSYIAGGFISSFDKQLRSEVDDSSVHGSGITVSTFIKMIEKQTSKERLYTHEDLRKLFGMDRQVLLSDI